MVAYFEFKYNVGKFITKCDRLIQIKLYTLHSLYVQKLCALQLM